jgi:hypothetical protein
VVPYVGHAVISFMEIFSPVGTEVYRSQCRHRGTQHLSSIWIKGCEQPAPHGPLTTEPKLRRHKAVMILRP